MAWRQRQEKKEHGSRTGGLRQLQNYKEGAGKAGNRRKLTSGGGGGVYVKIGSRKGGRNECSKKRVGRQMKRD